jgi:hypothetical protein
MISACWELVLEKRKKKERLAAGRAWKLSQLFAA